MEYIYAALLLDAAGKEVNEQNIKNVVKAAGEEPDEAMAKSVVSALKGVNIKDVIKNAQAMQAAAPAAAPAPRRERRRKTRPKRRRAKRKQRADWQASSADNAKGIEEARYALKVAQELGIDYAEAYLESSYGSSYALEQGVLNGSGYFEKTGLRIRLLRDSKTLFLFHEHNRQAEDTRRDREVQGLQGQGDRPI